MNEVRTVNLEAKELRAIVAKALGLPGDKVCSSHYGIAIKDTPIEEIDRRIRALLEGETP